MHHGTLGTGKHFNPREHQRHGRSRGRSGKNDQAGDPRHGEPVSAGQDTGGGFHRRPTHAGKETAGKRGSREGLDAQVETLKGALVKLEQKLEEAKSKRDLLLARHRRSVALGKAARAQTVLGDNSKGATFDRLKDRVHQTEAVATAEVELLTDDVGEKLTRLDRDAEVDRLLADLKARRSLPA